MNPARAGEAAAGKRKRVVVFGASCQSRVVRGVLEASGKFELVGWLDDDPGKQGRTINGLAVLGGMDWISRNSQPGLAAFVAIGNNDARVAVAARLRSLGLEMINAVHPSAVLMADIQLGTGVLVCAGAVVVSGTCLEDEVVVNTGATVDHDSMLHAGCYLAPGVRTGGSVKIGRTSFVGLGALLGPGVTIGHGAIVGAGSLVLKDVPDRVFAMGTPAQVVRELKEPVNWRRILTGK